MLAERETKAGCDQGLKKEIFVSPFLLATLKSLLSCWRLIRVLAFGMEASRGQRALRIDRSAEPHKKG